ncbi:Nif3-like dinuclear metal center hexameric protein [Syntrophobacter fumaroxidans]|uniref:GTP cyclohydrolase 1 type 2 homolog n=1 Tax=Syntrophobacter fumaroxidans (strain DSM 10017 / MPOB) TaxID=335543 RepID=A0LHK1_SYNFM|nr:Nif3-like dinuclear metal center hexameric protein [Syntrophobacter fumaroxidans]ABK16903.1 protein of unknown function DUF34 [Syntrophobacter fumaroxidans MPOB]
MPKVKDVMDWVDAYAPFRFSAGWDRCGLQVGDPEAELSRLLVALDPGSTTLGEALSLKCQCVVTHHPLIFQPLESVRADVFPGKLIMTAVREGISLICAHTNLDAARAGTNEQLARVFALQGVTPLEIDAAWQDEPRYAGMGCVGELPAEMSLDGLASFAAAAMGGGAVRVVGEPGRSVRRVAVCTGSGGGLLDAVITGRADVYITGDVKYHDAMRAEEHGLAVIDIGHFSSERVVLQPLAEYLRSRAVGQEAGLEVFVARREKDPLRIVGSAVEPLSP